MQEWYQRTAECNCSTVAENNLGITTTLKTKHTEKTANLKTKNEQGYAVISSSAKTKAEALCEFFSSIFAMKQMTTLNHLDNVSK